MTQASLGKAAQLHPTWICHIEAGRVNPTYGNVRRLAYALSVSLQELAELAQHHESRGRKR
jgi:predicted transcriptional regulator